MRRTVCRFVPPYLLQRLASRNGMTGGADAAEATLRQDDDLRRRRSQSPAQPREAAAGGGRRVIFDAKNAYELPGEVARTDDQPPTGDVAVDEAHLSSGQVWDLFAELFDRQSYDGQGTTAQVSVHYGVDYDNAFWDGQQFVFGDGDGEIFERFTKPMDVMAHEFTHGVVQYSADLVYSGQSGALNESVADVFAALTKQRSLDQEAAQANWLIGEGLFKPGVQATALRSMIEPGTAYDDPRIGKDPQVGSMADYVDTTEDNGGVHINSGIPNRAFALAAIALGGYSWERAGQVWYDALTAGEVGAEADFTAFAQATVSSAARVFSDDPVVGEAVRDAWIQVGVLGPGAASATEEESSADPAPAPPSETVAVKRTGGFAGGVRANVVDLTADPNGNELRRLLDRVDMTALAAEPGFDPMPDRFVYTVEYGEVRVTLDERHLGPELSQVVSIVLGQRRRSL